MITVRLTPAQLNMVLAAVNHELAGEQDGEIFTNPHEDSDANAREWHSLATARLRLIAARNAKKEPPHADRQRFEMSQSDYKSIIEAGRPVPMMMTHILPPEFFDPQWRVNKAWTELSDRMGFDVTTVTPTGEGDRFFTAMPRGPAPC